MPDLTSDYCDFAELDNAFVFVRLRSHSIFAKAPSRTKREGYLERDRGDHGLDENTMKTAIRLLPIFPHFFTFSPFSSLFYFIWCSLCFLYIALVGALFYFIILFFVFPHDVLFVFLFVSLSVLRFENIFIYKYITVVFYS